MSNDRPDPKLILLNDGKGRFTIGGTFGDPNWPTRNVTVADLDGDGYPDIAVATGPVRAMSASTMAKGTFLGNSHLDRRTRPRGLWLWRIFDGDGRLDIAACHEDLGLYVYFNAGKGNFGRGLEIAGREALPYSTLAADLNRDGKP